MYCSHCGVKASGNFCSGCGSRLASPVEEPIVPVVVQDWTGELRYDALLQFPEVRDLIAYLMVEAAE